MAMKDVGELRTKLKLDKSGFSGGLKVAGDDTKQFVSAAKEAFGQFIGVMAVAQQSISAFQEKLAEDTAFNRMTANMKRLNIYTPEAAQNIDRLTSNMEYLGAQQTQLYTDMLPLLTATRDTTKAMGLLDLAFRAHLATGSSVEQIIGAITGAMQGQSRVVMPLLRGWVEWNDGVKTAGDVLDIVRRRAGEATTVLSAQALAVLALKKTFSDLKEELVTFAGPGVSVVLKGWAMGFRTLRYMVEHATLAIRSFFELLKSPGSRKSIGEKYSAAAAAIDMAFYDEIRRMSEGPAGAGTGGGGDAWLQSYIDQLRSIMLRSDTGGAPGAKKSDAKAEAVENEAETIAEWLKQMSEEQERAGLEEHEAWMTRNATKIDAMKELGSITAQFMVDLPRSGKEAWEAWGNALVSMLQRLIQKLIEARLQAWLLNSTGLGQALGSGAGGGKVTPWEYVPSGGFGTASFGPPRIVPPGAGSMPTPVVNNSYSLQVQPHPQGTVFKVLRGNRIEFQRFAEDVWMTGGLAMANR